MKWLTQDLKTSSKYTYYWAELNMDQAKTGNSDAARELQVTVNKSGILFLFWLAITWFCWKVLFIASWTPYGNQEIKQKGLTRQVGEEYRRMQLSCPVHFLPALQLCHPSPGSKTPSEISLSGICVGTSNFWIAYWCFSSVGISLLITTKWLLGESEVQKI